MRTMMRLMAIPLLFAFGAGNAAAEEAKPTKNSPVPSQASEEDRFTACGQGRLLKGAASGGRRRPT